MSLLEAFSEKEKWFEVQPPARRAYAPEGTAKGGFQAELSASSGLRFKPDIEIGLFGIFEMVSNLNLSLCLCIFAQNTVSCQS